MSTYAKLLLGSLFSFVLFLNVSCDGGGPEFGGMRLAPIDTSGSLQAAADFPVGVGITADSMMNSSTYASIVRNQFDEVTLEYTMKQAPIVQSGGSFDYSYADAVLQFSQDAGLDVYGHTLIWHQNNNGSYLRSLVSGGGGEDDLGPNIMENGGFEAGSGDSFDNWAVYNNQDATFSATTEEDQVRSGDRALRIENTAAHEGEPWRVQIGNEEIPTEIGTDYQVSLWIKAENAGGTGRLSTQPTAQYQPDFNTSTSWIPITWTFTAEDPNTTVLLDMGYVANTYYVDDVEVREVEGGSSEPESILMNGGFEEGSGDSFDNWEVYNNQDATFTAGSGEEEVRSGERSLKIVNNAAHPDEPWRVQIASAEFPTEIGTDYQVSCWIKAENAGGSGRLSTQPTAQYQPAFNTSTSWIPITWTFTAEDPNTRILFDMGYVANTYYVDDVEVIPASETGGGGSGIEDSMAVDNFMREYITSTVNHYEGKVTGWDVVNEPLQDGTGELRTDLSPESPTEGGIFYWAKYLGAPSIANTDALGESYIANAFRYAEEADPDVPLYINDYNLESDATKRDSMVALVNGLLENDVPIDGIGTQMHINLNTSHAGIDQMFRDLASTGLMVKVTELDVRINPDDVASFEPTPTMLSYQQVMYHYVVWSYLQNVPEDQRAGITVWNLTDSGSWIVRGADGSNDYPTLYNDAYEKKPAYSGFLRGLKGMEPTEDN